MLRNEDEFKEFMERLSELNEIMQKLLIEERNTKVIEIQEANKLLIDPTETKEEEPAEEEEDTIDPEALSEEEKEAKRRSQLEKKRKLKSKIYKIRGDNALRRKEYTQAIEHYNKAIELAKENHIIYLQRALTYLQMDIYDKVEEDCLTVLKFRKDSLKAFTYLGKAYFESRQIQKSEDCLREAISRYPESKDAIHSFIAGFDLR